MPNVNIFESAKSSVSLLTCNSNKNYLDVFLISDDDKAGTSGAVCVVTLPCINHLN